LSLETVSVQCPYCGETIEIEVEALGEPQKYIEDCAVCCRPIEFEVSKSDEGVQVTASRSD